MYDYLRPVFRGFADTGIVLYFIFKTHSRQYTAHGKPRTPGGGRGPGGAGGLEHGRQQGLTRLLSFWSPGIIY